MPTSIASLASSRAKPNVPFNASSYRYAHDYAHWGKGAPVKDNQNIAPSIAIATFNASDHYEGHAAIYVSQDAVGIKVYYQYVTPPSPKSVGLRVLRWGAHGNSNNGNNFYVIE